MTDFVMWLAGWKTSKIGNLYRFDDEIGYGIKKNHTGWHWWQNKPRAFNKNFIWYDEFTWSIGLPSQEEAFRSLYGYLFEEKKAEVMTTIKPSWEFCK